VISLSCNIIVFFSFDTIPSEPIFLNCVFPFRWLVNEVRGMFQSLFGPPSEITPLSTTSIASFNASFVHLPLVTTTIVHVGIVGHYFLA
jgi:nitrate reductase NapE component